VILLHKKLIQIWYKKRLHILLAPLLPLSLLVSLIARYRFHKHQITQKNNWQPTVPVLIIGNITLGGTGKTPLIQKLVTILKQHGYHPGVVSRGYGANCKKFPTPVYTNSDPSLVGDEPVMHAEMNVPVVIDPDRVSAVKYLITNNECDVVLSDDGLQHYKLNRHIEMVIIDADRWYGNGFCLPAGPLREPLSRLKSVDFILVNGSITQSVTTQSVTNRTTNYSIELKPTRLVHLQSKKSISLCDLKEWKIKNKHIHAVAAIGNPDRFFKSLDMLGLHGKQHAYPDHYQFKKHDLNCDSEEVIIMTYKDAIKCQSIAHDNCWYLDTDLIIDKKFIDVFLSSLAKIRDQFSLE